MHFLSDFHCKRPGGGGGLIRLAKMGRTSIGERGRGSERWGMCYGGVGNKLGCMVT